LKRLPENDFWKNYFYNIEVIKYKYNMINKIKIGNEEQHQENSIIKIEEDNVLKK